VFGVKPKSKVQARARPRYSTAVNAEFSRVRDYWYNNYTLLYLLLARDAMVFEYDPNKSAEKQAQAPALIFEDAQRDCGPTPG